MTITFGVQVKTLRAVRGMSQAELAAQIGVAQALLSHIETGRVMPTPELEQRIREALDWPREADRAFAIFAR